jgi:hypothetical protein
MRWSHLHGDMQGRHACTGRAVHSGASRSKVKSEIPCRVSTNTCPATSREVAENRLISGKPSLPQWQRAIPREVLVTP